MLEQRAEDGAAEERGRTAVGLDPSAVFRNLAFFLEAVEELLNGFEKAVTFHFHFRKATPAAGSASLPEGARRGARARRGCC